MEAGNAAPALQVIVLVSIASFLLSVPIATIRFRLPHSPTLFPFSMPIASFPLLVSTYATNSPWNKEPSRAAFPRIAPTSLCAGPPLRDCSIICHQNKANPHNNGQAACSFAVNGDQPSSDESPILGFRNTLFLVHSFVYQGLD